jgi:hypothetical protein
MDSLKEKSAELAIFQLLIEINNALNTGQGALAIFLDVAKAFDSEDKLVLNKLKKYGFSSKSFNFFASYLAERKIECHDSKNGIRSKSFSVNCGVPQGSVLGPTLFLLFINDLPEFLPICKIVMFVDDVVILSSHSDLTQLFLNIQSTLSTTSEWQCRNLLLLNERKVQ